MHMHEEDSSFPVTLALAALAGVIAVACIAGLAALWQSIWPREPAPLASPAPPAHFSCRACGVVESVREVVHAPPRHEVSTVVGGGTEGIAVLLGALGGQVVTGAPPRTFEVLVRMADGTLRATREPGLPAWRPGEPVRIIKGQVQSAGEGVWIDRLASSCVAREGERVYQAWKDGARYCVRVKSGS